MFKLINSSLMKIFLNIQEFSRTPENIQGQQNVFQESRTKRVLIANSRTILGAQGRLAALAPQILTGPLLMVIYIKKISTLWHIPRPHSLYNEISYFLFHYFFCTTCGHNFDRTIARKSSIGGFVFVVALGILKMYI